MRKRLGEGLIIAEEANLNLGQWTKYWAAALTQES